MINACTEAIFIIPSRVVNELEEDSTAVSQNTGYWWPISSSSSISLVSITELTKATTSSSGSNAGTGSRIRLPTRELTIYSRILIAGGDSAWIRQPDSFQFNLPHPAPVPVKARRLTLDWLSSNRNLLLNLDSSENEPTKNISFFLWKVLIWISNRINPETLKKWRSYWLLINGNVVMINRSHLYPNCWVRTIGMV